MLKKEILEFTRNLEALRDFVDLLGHYLDEKRKELFDKRKTELVPLALAKIKLDSNVSSRNESDEERLRRAFDGEISISEQSDTDEGNGKRVVTIKVSGRDADNFDIALKELIRTGNQTGLLYQSSLINLTNTVEWFMSQLLHKYFDAYPDATGAKDNVFSLNDLKTFGSIEDARNYLVDCKVENILRASFEDWISFFKTNVKLGMIYLEKHRDRLVEIFQRRNIIVHNGGLINSIYLSKVAPEIRNDRKVGEKITISRRYIDNAIDIFELSFLLLAAELWHRQTDEEVEIADVLSNIAFAHLVKERWVVAEGLNKFIMGGKSLPEITQLFAKLNYWQAIKWQGRYDEIKQEVEEADFSGKGLVSQLALNSLTDNISEFFKLLPDVLTMQMRPELTGHKITYEDLETWPIFREIRKDPLYQQFREQHTSEFGASAGQPRNENPDLDLEAKQDQETGDEL